MSITMAFGSNVRGDNDIISDTDILKVCDFKNQKYEVDYGIHFYTKKRLGVLKQYKSLFLVHLKNEGKIISDESGWLNNFLNSIPNFTASNNSIELVKKYLILLLSITPSKQQELWWFDCLYVFLRDYFIKYNSKFNIYSFSPHSFAKPISTNYEHDLTHYILEMRKFKSYYRNKVITNINITTKYIELIKKNIATCLEIKIESHSLVSVLKEMTKNSEPYFKLRLIEGLYLNKEIIIIDNILLKFINSPHAYNWEIKNTNLNTKFKIK